MGSAASPGCTPRALISPTRAPRRLPGRPPCCESTAMTFYRPDTTSAPSSSAPNWDARVLTGDGHLALINLDDQIYTLRITRQGKLILTK